MNNSNEANRILEAISSLKKQGEKGSEVKQGVDLLSIVQKLSRNKERVAS